MRKCITCNGLCILAQSKDNKLPMISVEEVFGHSEGE